VVSFAAFGQAGQPAFEVASVKPFVATPGQPIINMLQGGPGSNDPQRVRGSGVTLQRLVREAYGIDFDQIQGPSWLGEERYELIANVPLGSTRDQLKLMLQYLLADRFKLAVHHISKDFPVYELTIAKDGSKLKENAETTLRPSVPGGPIMPSDQNGFPQLADGVAGMAMSGSNGLQRMTVRGLPLSALISQLSVFFGTITGANTFAMGRIVDKTDLRGKYDFKLEYAGGFGPGSALSLAAGVDADPAGGLPIAAAIEKQLGLKLAKSTAPFDVLVIDRIEKIPTDN
jgi:uncharacterized protein (TIGR03435 family)